MSAYLSIFYIIYEISCFMKTCCISNNTDFTPHIISLNLSLYFVSLSWCKICSKSLSNFGIFSLVAHLRAYVQLLFLQILSPQAVNLKLVILAPCTPVLSDFPYYTKPIHSMHYPMAVTRYSTIGIVKCWRYRHSIFWKVISNRFKCSSDIGKSLFEPFGLNIEKSRYASSQFFLL